MKRLIWLSLATVLAAIIGLATSAQALNGEVRPDAAKKCDTTIGCTTGNDTYCQGFGGCTGCTQGGGFNEHCVGGNIVPVDQ